MKEMKPHIIFIVCAVLLEIWVMEFESGPGGGFISFDNLMAALYHAVLVCYVVITLIIAGIIRFRRGKWNFGAAYGLALVVTPLMIFLTKVFDEIIRYFVYR